MPKSLGLFCPKYETKYGGAEVQMNLLSKELAKDTNYNVSFIVADYGQKILNIDNVKIYPSLNFEENLIQRIITFFKTFREVDAQIYVQMTLTYFSWLIALYCKVLGKKFVFLVAHDNDVDGTILNTKNTVLKKLSLLVFKFSSIVITQNEYQSKYLQNRRISNVIFNSSLEEIEKKNHKGQYHLWIARAEKWKKPEIFIQLAKEIPEREFLMICPSLLNEDDLYYQNLKEIALKVPNLKFVEKYIPYHQLSEIFSKAITFVNTSESEGFPTTFLHASQCGIPIASYNVNPNNFINTYKCGFDAKKDFNKLKEYIIKVSSDISLAKIQSKNCNKYFKENHCIETNINRFKEYLSF